MKSSTNFGMLSIKSGSEKATYEHTPWGQLVLRKESKTNGYISSNKGMWQTAHMLQCFEGFLLAGWPNINSSSISITFTFWDFNAAEAASSRNSPLIFLAFYRQGRCTQLQCVLTSFTHCEGLWPLLLPLSTGFSATWEIWMASHWKAQVKLNTSFLELGKSKQKFMSNDISTQQCSTCIPPLMGRMRERATAKGCLMWVFVSWDISAFFSAILPYLPH